MYNLSIHLQFVKDELVRFHFPPFSLCPSGSMSYFLLAVSFGKVRGGNVDECQLCNLLCLAGSPLTDYRCITIEGACHLVLYD